MTSPVIPQLRFARVEDARAMARFHRENTGHLSPWEPLRDARYHSTEAWNERLLQWEADRAAGHAACFLSVDSGHERIIATCSLTNIVRGAFQACNMGYAIAARYEGRGLMRQLCQHVIDHAFRELGLHRIMANYMPSNSRSGALLERLGFEREGLARKYLCINGRWEDHILTSLINPAHGD